jgi:hypothetical protein
MRRVAQSRAKSAEVVPVACTLGPEDLALQSGRWNDVLGRAGVERVLTVDGLRISFARADGLEDELCELASVEQGCCAWADWSIVVEGERVVLYVRSAGEGVAVLHGMF